MKKLKYIIIVAMGLLFAISSCSDKVERIRTLEVGESSLILNKEDQTKTVTVTVDKGASFTVNWDGDNWGSATADLSNGVVEIVVKENTTNTLRKAAIIVTLEGGFRNKVISVTQNGEAPLLSVVPDEISFDFMKNEFIIDVESNVEWSTSNTVDWLNIKTFIKTGAIVVAATENTNYNPRSTTITVTAGTSSKEVSVIQGAALSIIIPYLDTETASYDNILAFEQTRYSAVIKGGSRFAPHVAYTKSAFMPVISYHIKFNAIEFISIEQLDEKHLPGFFRRGSEMGKAHEFMIENNFEYLFSAGSRDYYWIDLGADSPEHYTVIVDNSDKYVTYNAMANRPDRPNTPSFDVFPRIPAEIVWGSHMDVAKAWEEANGGVISASEDKELSYNVPGDASYKIRIYLYKEVKTNLNSVIYVFNESEINKLFLVVLGGYMLNPNFESLLEQEGFTYIEEDGGYPIYGNAEKETMCKIYMATMGEDPTYYGVIEYRRTSTLSGAAPLKAQSITSPYKTLKGVNIIRK